MSLYTKKDFAVSLALFAVINGSIMAAGLNDSRWPWVQTGFIIFDIGLLMVARLLHAR